MAATASPAQLRAQLHKPHVSGPFGKAVCTWMFDSKWLARIEHTRALRITEHGHTGLRALFGLDCMTISPLSCPAI